MTWFRVDDNLAFHAKAVAAGNAAMGLWVRAGAWSSQQLTDGHVPSHMIPSLGNTAQAKALIRAGLWLQEEGGYRFWQWGERNPSRADVDADREAARERMAKRRRNKQGEFARSSPEHPPNDEGTPPERSPEQEENFGRSSESVRPPRPVPSRLVVTRSSESSSVTRGDSNNGDSDDLDGKIITIMAGLRPGQPIDRKWAEKIRLDITSRITDDVRDLPSYLAKCIRTEPDRYLPGHVPPPFELQADLHGPGTTDLARAADAARQALDAQRRANRETRPAEPEPASGRP